MFAAFLASSSGYRGGMQRCSGGADGRGRPRRAARRAPPFSINGTPDVDEHEAQKIRRRMRPHDAKVTARQEEEEC
jgi:hypothetical protein